MTSQIEVVGAVIVRDGLVLCTQRGTGPLAGSWEFPGGKLEDGESPRSALEREILKELQCVIEVGDEVTTATHEYEFGVVRLTTFYAVLACGEPRLTEHSAAIWLRADKLGSLDWAPADVPAVEVVRTRLLGGM